MLIDFPNSSWFRNYYPKTQKISTTLMELERISKMDCTCTSVYTYDKCDSCLAKGCLAQIEMSARTATIDVLLLRHKSKKRRR